MFFKVNGSLFSLAAQGLRRSKGQGPAGLGGAGFELWVCAGFPVLERQHPGHQPGVCQKHLWRMVSGRFGGARADGAWLSRQRWLIQLGTARPGPGGYPHRPAALGTLDEGMCRVGRRACRLGGGPRPRENWRRKRRCWPSWAWPTPSQASS